MLIEHIDLGEVGRLVSTHKDRLLGFGAALVFALCGEFGAAVVIINLCKPSDSYEEGLAKDVQEIIMVLPAQLYGSRCYRNSELVGKLGQVAKSL